MKGFGKVAAGSPARRWMGFIIGNILMAASMAMLRMSLFGNDPYSCMNLGFALQTGFSFGLCLTAANIVLFVPVLLWGRQYIKLGLFIYLFLLGPVSDAWYMVGVLALGAPETLGLMARVMLLIAGFSVCCFGVSFYMAAELGMGPYDALGWIVETRTTGRIPFARARIALDCTTTAIGFICGSSVGLGTLLMACGTGPFVADLMRHVSRPLLYGRD